MRSHGGSYRDDEAGTFMNFPFASSPRSQPHYPHPVLSSSAPSTFRFSRLPLSSAPPPATSFLSSALSPSPLPDTPALSSCSSSLPTPQLLSSFLGELRQLQDLLSPLQGEEEHTTENPKRVHGKGKDQQEEGRCRNQEGTPEEEDGGAERYLRGENDEEAQRGADAMIRRLLVHTDHQSQQHGLREELEAATAVVVKLHTRIAHVTAFVRFMARHGVVSEAATGTYGYFAALPNELILWVLSHTDPKTLLLSVSGLNRTWRQMAEDSNVWGVLYGKRWSSPFPSHAAIPRSASFYDMDVDDYHPRERKLKRRRYGWMERFKERACVDRNWMKRGAYSVCVKHVETDGHCTLAAASPSDSLLLLAHRRYIQGELRFVVSSHRWEKQGAFVDHTDVSGSSSCSSSSSSSSGCSDGGSSSVVLVTPHRREIVGLEANADVAVTSSSDGTALAWDMATGALLHTVARHDAEITQARLASLTTLITASDRMVGLWDVRTGDRTGTLDHQHAVRCIGVNDDDDSPVVSGSTDGIVRVWDRRKSHAPVAMLRTGGIPTALHLHEQGLLVAGNREFHHEPTSQRPAAYLQRWQGDQLSFSDSLRKPVWHFSADDSRVLLVQGGTVMAYDIMSPGLLATYDSSCAYVTSILFDPTRLLVVGDGQLAIHDFSGQSLEAFGYRQLHGVRVL